MTDAKMMRNTLNHDTGQRLIVFAHVMKTPVDGVPGRYQYYVETMQDVPSEDGKASSSTCVIWGSPMFDEYDDAIIYMNDKLELAVKDRHVET